jgi:hypothetical protein
MMTHQKKVDYFIADLKKRGIGESTAAPPMWKLAWRLGMDLPPPHFMGFISLAVVTGVPFGLLWGMAMWLLIWRGRPVWISATAAAVAGVLFGLVMAGYYRYSARRLKLPSWQKYPRS